MTKPLETIWPIEPLTAKKHEILRRYFQAWLPILDVCVFPHTRSGPLARMMKYHKPEVLVNFMHEEINRFLPRPDFAALFDAQFGTPKWREAVEISDPLARLRAIHDLYLNQL